MSNGYWDFKTHSWITVKGKNGKKQAVPVSPRRPKRRVASVVPSGRGGIAGYTTRELLQGVHVGGVRVNGKYYEIASGNPSIQSMRSAPIALWEFRSASSTNTTYTTRLNDDGKISCNCMGWTRKTGVGGIRHCKHVHQVMLRHSGNNDGRNLV